MEILESKIIPGKEGVRFGWYIAYRSHSNYTKILWREEFEHPYPPNSWGKGEYTGEFSVSPNRKMAVVEHIIPARAGFFSDQWEFVSGNPIGRHTIRIYVDGELIVEFNFEVIDVPPQPDQRWRKQHPTA